MDIEEITIITNSNFIDELLILFKKILNDDTTNDDIKLQAIEIMKHIITHQTKKYNIDETLKFYNDNDLINSTDNNLQNIFKDLVNNLLF